MAILYVKIDLSHKSTESPQSFFILTLQLYFNYFSFFLTYQNEVLDFIIPVDLGISKVRK